MDGKKIKVQRVIQGLSQQELADKAKISRAQLSLIETGKTSPTVSSLSRIANALGCEIKDFF